MGLTKKSNPTNSNQSLVGWFASVIFIIMAWFGLGKFPIQRGWFRLKKPPNQKKLTHSRLQIPLSTGKNCARKLQSIRETTHLHDLLD